jgi:hypothetical protein
LFVPAGDRGRYPRLEENTMSGPKQQAVNPAVVEKGQWVYTTGHRVETWREVVATAVMLDGGDQQLKVRSANGLPIPLTIPRGRTVWVRDNEEGE